VRDTPLGEVVVRHERVVVDWQAGDAVRMLHGREVFPPQPSTLPQNFVLPPMP
jgi:hypothetical protein